VRQRISHRIVEAIATGLYLGKMKFAPGTWGTLLGIPLAWVFATQFSWPGYPIAIAVLFVVSVVSAELHERFTKTHDPGEIVIDEVLGFVVTMYALPLTWQSFLAAFLMFRFFDIVKPPPIRQLDRAIKGGFGTTLDDFVAGLAANLLLFLLLYYVPWWSHVIYGS